MGKITLPAEINEYEIYQKLIMGTRWNMRTGKQEVLNLQDFYNKVKDLCHRGLVDLSIWRQENYPDSCQFDGSYPLEDLESDLYEILDFID